MRRHDGFSMIEMLFVLIIGAILIAIVAPAFGRMQSRRSAENARDAFVWFANRARSESVNRGQEVTLRVSPTDSSATMTTAAGDTIDRLRFIGDIDANVKTSTGSAVNICYLPRGYARDDCPSNARTVDFYIGQDTFTVEIRVLGQVVKE